MSTPTCIYDSTRYGEESVSTQRFGAVCASAGGGGKTRVPSRPGTVDPGKSDHPHTRVMKSSRTSINPDQRIKLSTALLRAKAQLAEAERDIKKMQEDGLDEHPVQSCTSLPQCSSINYARI